METFPHACCPRFLFTEPSAEAKRAPQSLQLTCFHDTGLIFFFFEDSVFQRWPFDHLIRSSLPCDSLTVLPLSLQLILPDPLVLSQLRSSRTPRTDVFSHSAWLDLSLRTERGLYKPGSDSSFVTLITNRPPFLFLSHILALFPSSSFL